MACLHVHTADRATQTRDAKLIRPSQSLVHVAHETVYMYLSTSLCPPRLPDVYNCPMQSH